MRRIIILGLMLAGLAACQQAPPPPDQITAGSVIQWERNPEHIVFRADVVGGVASQLFRARNEIPPCTIYGDNRVVWTNDLGNFNTQVLWDQVTNQQVENFITYLTVVERIFTYEAGIDRQMPGGDEPVVQQITVSVNGQQHLTDSLGGWDMDYFQRVVGVCRQISQSPVLFEPLDGAWVSAQLASQNPNVPMIIWDAERTGVSFADLAQTGERIWLNDRNTSALWNIFRTSSPVLQFLVDDTYYEVALEVPGVSRDAPPPPDGV